MIVNPVASPERHDDELLRIDSVNPPTAEREPVHAHPKQESGAEVLSGSLVFEVAGEQRRLGAGETISVPANTPHRFWNDGSEDARSIQFFRPALDIAAVLSVPGEKRSVFVIPWGDRIYVGTTDTDYDGPLDDPQCTAADVDYLLGALNAWLTKPVGRHEVHRPACFRRPLTRGRHRLDGDRIEAGR